MALALNAGRCGGARDKVFGYGRPRPMDREAKVRIAMLARILKRRVKVGDSYQGKHYGKLTAKMVDVLEALLFQFHNAKSGHCFPSLESIAAAAHCVKSTVQRALAALEECGLLTWVHRLVRRKEYDPLSRSWRLRVYRTSNGYAFSDPRSSAVVVPFPGSAHGNSSKTENRSGTTIQDSSLSKKGAAQLELLPNVERALGQLRQNFLTQNKKSGP